MSTKVAVFPEKNATSCWLSSGTSTHFWKFHINKELHAKDIFFGKGRHFPPKPCQLFWWKKTLNSLGKWIPCFFSKKSHLRNRLNRRGRSGSNGFFENSNGSQGPIGKAFGRFFCASKKPLKIFTFCILHPWRFFHFAHYHGGLVKRSFSFLYFHGWWRSFRWTRPFIGFQGLGLVESHRGRMERSLSSMWRGKTEMCRSEIRRPDLDLQIWGCVYIW